MSEYFGRPEVPITSAMSSFLSHFQVPDITVLTQGVSKSQGVGLLRVHIFLTKRMDCASNFPTNMRPHLRRLTLISAISSEGLSLEDNRMSNHTPASSLSSSLSTSTGEDNQIERIAGVHLDGDEYLRLGWEIQYFSSQEINPILLRVFLEGRFGRDGYGLSLIGNTMYQLWLPGGEQLTQVSNSEPTQI